MAAIERYRELLSAVDHFFDEVRTAHSSEMECGRGCSSCCHQQVAIAQIESDSLESTIAALSPEQRDELTQSVRAALPSGDKAGPDVCGALGPDGACQIYSGRPMACRSWGLMNFYSRGRRDQSGSRTMLPIYTKTCWMNFPDRDLRAGAAADAPPSFDVEHWNEALRVVNNERAVETGAAISPDLEREITLNWRLAELLGCRPGDLAPVPDYGERSDSGSA